MKRKLVAALSLGLFTAAVLACSPASAQPPTLGPGAVISMHRQIFRALDQGQPEKVISYLSPDLNMDLEYQQRPCSLFLVNHEGKSVESRNYEQSQELLAGWAKHWVSHGANWKTEIISAKDDCFSGELSWCVLEFERTGEIEGRPVRQRFRSTSLVTYDKGWKLTHWHVSPAEEVRLSAPRQSPK